MIHCHFCGANAVSQHSSTETYQYKQQAYNVLVDYSVCNQCGEEIITTEQIHANEARVREAKKSWMACCLARKSAPFASV